MDIGNLRRDIVLNFNMSKQNNLIPILASLSGLVAFLTYIDTRKQKKDLLNLEAELKREQLKKIKNI